MQAGSTSGISLLQFIDKNTLLAVKDLAWVLERMHSVATDTISQQLLLTEEGDLHAKEKLIDTDDFSRYVLDFKRIDYGVKSFRDETGATLSLNCSPQPIYHKNFDLVSESFSSLLQDGYKLYILSDSEKQTQRIANIFEDKGENIPFTPVSKTLHEGFIDNELHLCFFTDHQLFDRFHKYQLRSDKARSGKLALSLKELRQFEVGDYIVHIDHGVGKFGGLFRTELNGSMQEVIKLIYQNDDILFVSIHALHKLAKYRAKEGEPPRINKLGSGAWEKMKDSMVTDKKILPAVSQTLETAEAGIEKNVTEKSDSRLTKTVTTDTGDAGIIKKVVTGKTNTEVSLPAEIVPPATDDSNLIENDSEKPEMMLVTEDGFIIDGTGTITGVADYEKAVKEGRLTLPSSDQCSKIAATTFTDAPDGILEIVIPANIIFIEEGTFADLKDVEWYETEPDNPVYVSRDGVLFSEQETCLFAFPAGRTGIYPIPENVVRLAKDAFSESRLFKVIGMKERGMEQTDLPDTLVVE